MKLRISCFTTQCGVRSTASEAAFKRSRASLDNLTPTVVTELIYAPVYNNYSDKQLKRQRQPDGVRTSSGIEFSQTPLSRIEGNTLLVIEQIVLTPPTFTHLA
ncbi:hypothetical protein D3C85_966790 [compost metagenome]